jgi:hypothetical protein
MPGEILSGNDRMLKLAGRLGFTITKSPEDSGIKLVSKML